MSLLFLGALLATAHADDLPAGHVDDEEEPPAYIPAATYPRDTPGFWIGATPPTLLKPWASNFLIGFGIEVNVRAPLPIAWLQHELRVAFDYGIAAYYLIPYPSGDYQLVATTGPRFGLDRGFYGGVGIGAAYIREAWVDGDNRTVVPAATLYGGYTFRAGDHMRVAPEISLGVRNTLALRMEWGG